MELGKPTVDMDELFGDHWVVHKKVVKPLGQKASIVLLALEIFCFLTP